MENTLSSVVGRGRTVADETGRTLVDSTGDDWRLSTVAGFFALCVGVASFVLWVGGHEPPTSTTPTAKYTAGDCIRFPAKEAWEHDIDYVVIAVGEENYLIESVELAVRNYGKKPWRRNEWATTVPFGWLNEGKRIDCPLKGLAYK